MFVCLFAFLFTARVMAPPALDFVDPTNIKTLPFEVKVKSAVDDNQFTVIVDPKSDGSETLLGASLEVYDDKNVVCSCSVAGDNVRTNMDIKKPLDKNGIMFEFSLATKYLAASKFQVLYQANVNMPAIHIYTFFLKDFTHNAK